MKGLRIGVDIGGTFTDIVLLDDDGRVLTRKVPSTPDDYARGIVDGLAALFAASGVGPGEVEEVLHATTVASNAILERKGARVGLVGTEGFRDVLEIRSLRMPRLYDIAWEKPPPLVERRLRVTVDERIDARGNVRRALERADAERAIDRLVAEGVDVIAVCLINAFANPEHERLIEAVARERAPGIPCTTSHDVLPEIKEYERTSTTVINAYVMPVVAHYLASLRRELDRGGLGVPLLLMQSNGGLLPAEEAARHPAHIIESGPAAGVVGAQVLAARLGLPDVVTFDMGGTTAKASLVEGGAFTRSQDYQVGGGIMRGSRLLTGSGYLLRVPAIDLAEVGAGGGSIVSVDAGGSLQVGPESAGAVPGPVCYGRGGDRATVTDANVVLGYLNPEFLVGGELTLDADASARAIAAQVAEPLGIDVAHAAYGAHQVAAATMMRAIRAVSSERGRDPRRYALFAFGGNGPLFAATMARGLGMRRIVVPPGPGLFSAFGLLYAEVEHHYSRSLLRLVATCDPSELEAAWAELERRAHAQLTAEGFPPERQELLRSAHLHYKGQSYELEVPAPSGTIDAAALAAIEDAFGREHERTYGHRAGREEPVELVHLGLLARGRAERPRTPAGMLAAGADGSRPRAARSAYFGPELGWLETTVVGRAALTTVHPGPCIVEEYDATCLVPPGARAVLDDASNIVIELD
ncbi:MAG: hydantoinase/oxoprolinase family protein [Ectothiorhodospiraceae bacterium]|nr:hydantoinase/oxoprolinase family protein [Ectothiorhodospiraceae bacterium]